MAGGITGAGTTTTQVPAPLPTPSRYTEIPQGQAPGTYGIETTPPAPPTPTTNYPTLAQIYTGNGNYAYEPISVNAQTVAGNVVGNYNGIPIYGGYAGTNTGVGPANAAAVITGTNGILINNPANQYYGQYYVGTSESYGSAYNPFGGGSAYVQTTVSTPTPPRPVTNTSIAGNAATSGAPNIIGHVTGGPAGLTDEAVEVINGQVYIGGVYAYSANPNVSSVSSAPGVGLGVTLGGGITSPSLSVGAPVGAAGQTVNPAASGYVSSPPQTILPIATEGVGTNIALGNVAPGATLATEDTGNLVYYSPGGEPTYYYAPTLTQYTPTAKAKEYAPNLYTPSTLTNPNGSPITMTQNGAPIFGQSVAGNVNTTPVPGTTAIYNGISYPGTTQNVLSTGYTGQAYAYTPPSSAPLAGVDYATFGKNVAIQVTGNQFSGSYVQNGQTYNFNGSLPSSVTGNSTQARNAAITEAYDTLTTSTIQGQPNLSVSSTPSGTVTAPPITNINMDTGVITGGEGLSYTPIAGFGGTTTGGIKSTDTIIQNYEGTGLAYDATTNSFISGTPGKQAQQFTLGSNAPLGANQFLYQPKTLGIPSGLTELIGTTVPAASITSTGGITYTSVPTSTLSTFGGETSSVLAPSASTTGVSSAIPFSLAPTTVSASAINSALAAGVEPTATSTPASIANQGGAGFTVLAVGTLEPGQQIVSTPGGTTTVPIGETFTTSTTSTTTGTPGQATTTTTTIPQPQKISTISPTGTQTGVPYIYNAPTPLSAYDIPPTMTEIGVNQSNATTVGLTSPSAGNYTLLTSPSPTKAKTANTLSANAMLESASLGGTPSTASTTPGISPIGLTLLPSSTSTTPTGLFNVDPSIFAGVGVTVPGGGITSTPPAQATGVPSFELGKGAFTSTTLEEGNLGIENIFSTGITSADQANFLYQTTGINSTAPTSTYEQYEQGVSGETTLKAIQGGINVDVSLLNAEAKVVGNAESTIASDFVPQTKGSTVLNTAGSTPALGATINLGSGLLNAASGALAETDIGNTFVATATARGTPVTPYQGKDVTVSNAELMGITPSPHEMPHTEYKYNQYGDIVSFQLYGVGAGIKNVVNAALPVPYVNNIVGGILSQPFTSASYLTGSNQTPVGTAVNLGTLALYAGAASEFPTEVPTLKYVPNYASELGMNTADTAAYENALTGIETTGDFTNPVATGSKLVGVGTFKTVPIGETLGNALLPTPFSTAATDIAEQVKTGILSEGEAQLVPVGSELSDVTQEGSSALGSLRYSLGGTGNWEDFINPDIYGSIERQTGRFLLNTLPVSTALGAIGAGTAYEQGYTTPAELAGAFGIGYASGTALQVGMSILNTVGGQAQANLLEKNNAVVNTQDVRNLNDQGEVNIQVNPSGKLTSYGSRINAEGLEFPTGFLYSTTERVLSSGQNYIETTEGYKGGAYSVSATQSPVGASISSVGGMDITTPGAGNVGGGVRGALPPELQPFYFSNPEVRGAFGRTTTTESLTYLPEPTPTVKVSGTDLQPTTASALQENIELPSPKTSQSFDITPQPMRGIDLISSVTGSEPTAEIPESIMPKYVNPDEIKLPQSHTYIEGVNPITQQVSYLPSAEGYGGRITLATEVPTEPTTITPTGKDIIPSSPLNQNIELPKPSLGEPEKVTYMQQYESNQHVSSNIYNYLAVRSDLMQEESSSKPGIGRGVNEVFREPGQISPNDLFQTFKSWAEETNIDYDRVQSGLTKDANGNYQANNYAKGAIASYQQYFVDRGGEVPQLDAIMQALTGQGEKESGLPQKVNLKGPAIPLVYKTPASGTFSGTFLENYLPEFRFGSTSFPTATSTGEGTMGQQIVRTGLTPAERAQEVSEINQYYYGKVLPETYGMTEAQIETGKPSGLTAQEAISTIPNVQYQPIQAYETTTPAISSASYGTDLSIITGLGLGTSLPSTTSGSYAPSGTLSEPTFNPPSSAVSSISETPSISEASSVSSIPSSSPSVSPSSLSVSSSSSLDPSSSIASSVSISPSELSPSSTSPSSPSPSSPSPSSPSPSSPSPSSPSPSSPSPSSPSPSSPPSSPPSETPGSTSPFQYLEPQKEKKKHKKVKKPARIKQKRYPYSPSISVLTLPGISEQAASTLTKGNEPLVPRPVLSPKAVEFFEEKGYVPTQKEIQAFKPQKQYA